MLDFYGVLVCNPYERVYHCIKNNNKEVYHPGSMVYNHVYWTIDFEGDLKEEEKGKRLLLKQGKTYKGEKEYLIALYLMVGEEIVNFISEDAFLLLDNEREVYIHHCKPLYCARKKTGGIYISSDLNTFPSKVFSLIKKNCSLLFYNNNLKGI